jgi:hypothetical protein
MESVSVIRSVAVDSDSSELADYKDEVNSALGDLKSQIDKVKSDNGDAKVGGTIFFRWQKYLAGNSTKSPVSNNFDVDRAYIDIKKKLAGDSAVRVTLDVARLATATSTTSVTANTSTQQLFDYLKYAYIDVPVGIPSNLQIVPVTLTGKFGLQHTAWIDWADKIMNIRYIAKSIMDNEGVLSSSDFGLGAVGKFTLPSLPEIEYHATALNGSGYKATETNTSKSIALRLNSTIYQDANLGNVIVGVFFDEESADDKHMLGTSSKNAAMLALKGDYATVYAEGINGSNGMYGCSSGLMFSPVDKLNAFCRFDNYNPQSTNLTKLVDRTFYGITYDWNKDFKVALDVQKVTGGPSAPTSAGKSTSIIYLHTMTSF